jgi:hypothetical protein
MTAEQQEILEGIKTIARFIKWTEQEIDIYMMHKPDLGKLAFHNRIDLLFEVITKIESIEHKEYNYEFSITGDGISFTKFDDGSGIITTRVNPVGKDKCLTLFKCVVDFIKWHNQQTTNG